MQQLLGPGDPPPFTVHNAAGKAPLRAPTPNGETVLLQPCDLPVTLEAEPNDDKAHATRISLPCAIGGRIGVSGKAPVSLPGFFARGDGLRRTAPPNLAEAMSDTLRAPVDSQSAFNCRYSSSSSRMLTILVLRLISAAIFDWLQVHALDADGDRALQKFNIYDHPVPPVGVGQNTFDVF